MGQSDLKGQLCLVTGASGGVGGAIALALARQGATVILAGRNAERLAAAAQGVVAGGGEAHVREVDLACEENVRALGEWIAGRWGRLDILVHSAGVHSTAKTEEASLAELDRLFQSNVRGPYALTQRLLPLLKAPRGQVVFINSSAGLAARAGVGQYSAMQHASKALADALRDEVNPDHVRVLNVHLGRTATPMIARVFAQEGRAYDPSRLLQPEDVAAIVVSSLVLPWTAEVTSISIRPMNKS